MVWTVVTPHIALETSKENAAPVVKLMRKSSTDIVGAGRN